MSTSLPGGGRDRGGGGRGPGPELRVRYGAFFDLRIPRDRIAGVRSAHAGKDSHLVTVDGEELGVRVASMTNLVVELVEPVTAVRPLGGQVQVRTVRWYADDPRRALAALRPAEPRSADGRRTDRGVQ
ncbi:MAG TPA: hypothetical protein VI248_26630 [Kineosporiaceae bacterium]